VKQTHTVANFAGGSGLVLQLQFKGVFALWYSSCFGMFPDFLQVCYILLRYSPAVQLLQVGRAGLASDRRTLHYCRMICCCCCNPYAAAAAAAATHTNYAHLQVYCILLRHSPVVQPLSVDEAYLDLTLLGSGCSSSEVQQLVGQIRQEIEAATGCTASAGRVHLLRYKKGAGASSCARGDHDLTPLGFSSSNSSKIQQLVGQIRQEIEAATGCTASAGTVRYG
jgi:hypothetical protein